MGYHDSVWDDDVDTPSPSVSEMLVETEKQKGRDHIKRMWKDGGPNQKIKLVLPRWFWESVLR